MGLSVFSVTPAGLLFVCVLCLAAEDTLFSALLLAAAVHELGHLAVMAAAGYRPERITLEWMGVSITCGLMPPGRELVTALAGDTGWTKATVNVMLTRLAEKGAVAVDATGRSKLFTPLLAREDAVRREARSCLEKVKPGGLGLLLSAMTEDCALTEEEIAELERILKEARHA